MSGKKHSYETRIEWTGNKGTGTSNYRSYGRDHSIQSKQKPVLLASSDPAFRGDPARYNPEEFLLASLSSCHMLAYLHLCAVNSVVVVAYEDAAQGWMEETADGGGHFTEAVLRPRVTVAVGSDTARAQSLHHDAHRLCFIANSVNFPVETEAEILVADQPAH